MTGQDPGRLEVALTEARSRGRKCLVPYITGGLEGWQAAVEAAATAGADAVEIGIPFSDPVMDGPTIQEAGDRALATGATPTGILSAAAAGMDVGVPLVVMTYYWQPPRRPKSVWQPSAPGPGVSSTPSACWA